MKMMGFVNDSRRVSISRLDVRISGIRDTSKAPKVTEYRYTRAHTRCLMGIKPERMLESTSLALKIATRCDTYPFVQLKVIAVRR